MTDENAKANPVEYHNFTVQTWDPYTSSTNQTQYRYVDWKTGTSSDQYMWATLVPNTPQQYRYTNPEVERKENIAVEQYKQEIAVQLEKMRQKQLAPKLPEPPVGAHIEPTDLEKFVKDMLGISEVLVRVHSDYNKIYNETNSRSEQQAAYECMNDLARSIVDVRHWHAKLTEMLSKCAPKQTSNEPSKNLSDSIGASR